MRLPLPPLLSGDIEASSTPAAATGRLCPTEIPLGLPPEATTWPLVLLPLLDSAGVLCGRAEPASPAAAEAGSPGKPALHGMAFD